MDLSGNETGLHLTLINIHTKPTEAVAEMEALQDVLNCLQLNLKVLIKLFLEILTQIAPCILSGFDFSIYFHLELHLDCSR